MTNKSRQRNQNALGPCHVDQFDRAGLEAGASRGQWPASIPEILWYLRAMRQHINKRVFQQPAFPIGYCGYWRGVSTPAYPPPALLPLLGSPVAS
jgi:hypothetical protein